jgi:restriction system protein
MGALLIWIFVTPVALLVLLLMSMAKSAVEHEKERTLVAQRKADQDRERAQDLAIDAFLNDAPRYIKPHARALARKRRQRRFVDEYGVPREEAWRRECSFFISDVLSRNPEVPSHLLELPKAHLALYGVIDRCVATLDLEPPALQEVTSAYEFESYCCQVMQDAGWRAHLTASGGDQGVDVLCEYGSYVVAMQCKFYRRAVGNSAVQEVVAGCMYYSANEAVVVASNGFTKAARQLAESTGVVLLGTDDLLDYSRSRLRAIDYRSDGTTGRRLLRGTPTPVEHSLDLDDLDVLEVEDLCDDK